MAELRQPHIFGGRRYKWYGFALSKRELDRTTKALRGAGHRVHTVLNADLARWEIYVRLKR